MVEFILDYKRTRDKYYFPCLEITSSNPCSYLW